MFDQARFAIIGRITKVAEFEKCQIVTIASNASYKDKKTDQWVDRTYWNQVKVFDEATRARIVKSWKKGEYVRAEGTVQQGSYKKGDETIYTTDLVADEFSFMPRTKADKSEAA